LATNVNTNVINVLTASTIDCLYAFDGV